MLKNINSQQPDVANNNKNEPQANIAKEVKPQPEVAKPSLAPQTEAQAKVAPAPQPVKAAPQPQDPKAAPAPQPAKPAPQPQAPKAAPAPQPAKPAPQPQAPKETPSPQPAKPAPAPLPQAPKAAPAPQPAKPATAPAPQPQAPKTAPAPQPAKPATAPAPQPQAPKAAPAPQPAKPAPAPQPQAPKETPAPQPAKPAPQPQAPKPAPAPQPKVMPNVAAPQGGNLQTTNPTPATGATTDPNAPVLEGEPIIAAETKDEVIKPNFISRFVRWFAAIPPSIKIFIIFILIPTVASFIYFMFFASSMYVTTVQFAIKSSSSQASVPSIATQIFKMPGTTSNEVLIVEEYLRSYDAFNNVNKELNIIKHYSDSNYDLISRLNVHATQKDKIDFWNSVANVQVDQDSGIINFTIRAYTPQMAQQIAQNILKQSEQLINDMNERQRADNLSLANNELKLAQDKLSHAQSALKIFRNQHKDIDLKTTASGLQEHIIALEGEATKVETELAQMKQYLGANTIQVKNKKAQLQAMREQIAREKAKVTATNGINSINELAGQYENLLLDSEFARKQVETALANLEIAKMQNMAKSLYVVPITQPSLPDESLYPKPFLFSFYIFIGLTATVLICSLVIAAIKEHMGF